jgi:uncharacterized cupredoxin-like copper-binding protein
MGKIICLCDVYLSARFYTCPNLKGVFMKKRVLLFVASLALLALSACGGDGAGAPQTSYDVDMADFAFMPMTYTVPAGEVITMHFTNSGAVVHEFAIMNYGTEASSPFGAEDSENVYWEFELMPGEEATVTFTAPMQSGKYQVVCGIAGHMEAGMVATMFVVAP